MRSTSFINSIRGRVSLVVTGLVRNPSSLAFSSSVSNESNEWTSHCSEEADEEFDEENSCQVIHLDSRQDDAQDDKKDYKSGQNQGPFHRNGLLAVLLSTVQASRLGWSNLVLEDGCALGANVNVLILLN